MDDSVRKILQRLWNLVARGRLTGKDGSKAMRTIQTELFAQDIRDDVEHFEPYGFSSEPLLGAEPLTVSFSGNRDHTVAICVADRRYRIKGMKDGEVAIFDHLGRKVHITQGGIVVDGKSSPVTVTTSSTVSVKGSKITLDAPVVQVTGKMVVAGDVTGGNISLQSHIHTGDSGGNTSAPK